MRVRLPVYGIKGGSSQIGMNSTTAAADGRRNEYAANGRLPDRKSSRPPIYGLHDDGEGSVAVDELQFWSASSDSRGSGFQLPGTIGSDGPLPKSSPASVVNPAGAMS